MIVRYDLVTVLVVRSSPGGHELLQIRRAPGRHAAGAWSTVYGSVNAGEASAAAAQRELFEETSLTPIELYSIGIQTFYIATMDTTFHSPVFCAMVAPDAVVSLNHEHEAYRWVPRSDAPSHFLFVTERLLLAAPLAEILDDGPSKPYLRVR